MRAILVFATVACLALAGCTKNSSGEGMSAMDARSGLDAAASDWASDALLFGIAGLEASHNFTFEDPDEEGDEDPMDNETAEDDADEEADEDEQLLEAFLSARDTQLGDGLAPVWVGVYMSFDNKALAFFVADADEARLLVEVDMSEAGEFPEEARDMIETKVDESLAAWEIDSPEAIAAVRGANASLDQAFAAGAQAVYYGLDLEDVSWEMGGLAGALRFRATVDAASGEVTEIQVGPDVELPPGFGGSPATPPLPPPIHESGSNQATIDPLNLLPNTPPCSTPRHQCVEIPFELGLEATIDATLSWTMDANDYDFYILEAESRDIVVTGANDLTQVGAGSPEHVNTELEPGSYIVQIVPWAVAQDTWTFDATFSLPTA